MERDEIFRKRIVTKPCQPMGSGLSANATHYNLENITFHVFVVLEDVAERIDLCKRGNFFSFFRQEQSFFWQSFRRFLKHGTKKDCGYIFVGGEMLRKQHKFLTFIGNNRFRNFVLRRQFMYLIDKVVSQILRNLRWNKSKTDAQDKLLQALWLNAVVCHICSPVLLRQTTPIPVVHILGKFVCISEWLPEFNCFEIFCSGCRLAIPDAQANEATKLYKCQVVLPNH